MLQMMALARKAKDELDLMTPFPPQWESMKELEQVTNHWMDQWLLRRNQVAGQQGLYAKLSDYIDRTVRTDLPELTDSPEVLPQRKLRIVRKIYMMSVVLGACRHYYKILTPLIHEIASSKNRPVRLLELASGSSEVAMNLAAMAKKDNLPVEITVSDYIEDMVEDAKSRARNRGLKMRFRTINIRNMEEALGGDRYDIFLIIGSMHHFTPGQLAVMLAETRRTSDPGSLFIGLDLHRFVGMLFFLPFSHVITFSSDNIYDAWLTARKAYSLYELEQIARIALPGASVTASHSFPSLSVLKARF
jgi:ubiquinone/menaquinone biosynthesis C-methylase UbiE